VYKSTTKEKNGLVITNYEAYKKEDGKKYSISGRKLTKEEFLSEYEVDEYYLDLLDGVELIVIREVRDNKGKLGITVRLRFEEGWIDAEIAAKYNAELIALETTKAGSVGLKQTNNSGSKYDSFDIIVSGDKVGVIDIDKGDTNSVHIIDISPEFQGKGVAGIVYEQLAEKYGELSSSKPEYMEDNSIKVWDKLVRKGVAVKNVDGSYTIKLTEQSIKEQPKADNVGVGEESTDEARVEKQFKTSGYDSSKNVEVTWTSGVNSSGKITSAMLAKDKGENTSWRIAQTPSNQFVIDQISPKNENAIATRHESLVRPFFNELNLPEKGNNKAIIIKPAIIEYDRQTGEGRVIEKGVIAWNKIPEYSTAQVAEKVEETNPDSNLLNLVREAYRLHEQAIENDTTFKEEAEKENMRIHNNKMDDHVDSGKTTGNITLITSNPNDLKNNRLNDDNNNVSRFNFLDNLLTGKLDKANFKMTLGLSEKGNIFGIVADTQGMPVKFDEEGMPHGAGLPILFYLDYDMFTSQNINKRRSDVVAPPFKLAPLATSPGVAGKNDDISFAPPLDLHRSFVDRDVIEMLKDRIRRTTVTASIDFITQGLLFREGTTNSYAAIPKNAPTHTASDLFEKGHIRDEKGEIHLDDIFLSGVYRRAHRIQFAMFKNINRHSDGTEIAEFRPLALKDVTNEEGKKIVDILKAENGQNFFEAAVTGNLEATKENMTTLVSLLRQDKFLILNLGTNILVVSAKRFKKLMKDDNITTEKLMSLTKVEDLLNAEINITKTFYDNSNEVELLTGILGEGRNNYSRFINRNVVTSTKPLTKTSEIEGYARINKRIALTLDESMDDMIKAINQKEQENKAPEVTEVETITEVELSESEKKSAIFTPINPDVEENLDDDFTNTDC